jgi:hypothetical protein
VLGMVAISSSSIPLTPLLWCMLRFASLSMPSLLLPRIGARLCGIVEGIPGLANPWTGKGEVAWSRCCHVSLEILLDSHPWTWRSM